MRRTAGPADATASVDGATRCIDRVESGDYDRAVRLRFLAASLLILGSAGCPREVQEPEPGEATPCDTLADCNGGRACGSVPLRACVDGLCEEQPSLVIPCLDGG